MIILIAKIWYETCCLLVMVNITRRVICCCERLNIFGDFISSRIPFACLNKFYQMESLCETDKLANCFWGPIYLMITPRLWHSSFYKELCERTIQWTVFRPILVSCLLCPISWTWLLGLISGNLMPQILEYP